MEMHAHMHAHVTFNTTSKRAQEIRAVQFQACHRENYDNRAVTSYIARSKQLKRAQCAGNGFLQAICQVLGARARPNPRYVTTIAKRSQPSRDKKHKEEKKSRRHAIFLSFWRWLKNARVLHVAAVAATAAVPVIAVSLNSTTLKQRVILAKPTTARYDQGDAVPA
ncbi:uncharacterized protein V1518DRAFT_407164 [Limtongia smithiae]|uniref:uncharacterized protein n=1 Tax=Limtongia smithiae TaxID=1125753 RepID=UPI0034CF0AB7